MVLGATHIPNEVANQVVYVGTEAQAGVLVTPTARVLGDIAITKTVNYSRTEEATGGYDRLVTPRKQLPTYSGT